MGQVKVDWGGNRERKTVGQKESRSNIFREICLVVTCGMTFSEPKRPHGRAAAAWAWKCDA